MINELVVATFYIVTKTNINAIRNTFLSLILEYVNIANVVHMALAITNPEYPSNVYCQCFILKSPYIQDHELFEFQIHHSFWFYLLT